MDLKEEAVQDIKKNVPNVYLRLLLYLGITVMGVLFGMWVRSDTSNNKQKDQDIVRLNEIIKDQGNQIQKKDIKIQELNDLRIADKEEQYHNLLKRQNIADSINLIKQSIAEKLKRNENN